MGEQLLASRPDGATRHRRNRRRRNLQMKEERLALANPGHASAQALTALQQRAGNQAVQRLLSAHRKPKVAGIQDKEQEKPKVAGQEDKEQEQAEVQRHAVAEPGVRIDAPLQRVVQRHTDDLIGPAGPFVQRAALAFDLTKPAPKRSNSDASTTSAENPTFTGSAKKRGKGWGYKLDTVEAKGKIQIVYYTADRYPAPTPEDDSGALTNVTDANFKAILADFKKNRRGIADHWSAYRAEDLHEDYHWQGEWQKLVRAGVKKAEKQIGKLKVDATTAPSASDAEKVLEPQAKVIFDGAMNDARAKWNAMGDAPGDPPYRAQAPAIDALGARVKKYAKSQKWK